MKKKYAMTLLEIMIVIFIIGIIGSVIGYNMKGSLNKGKAFKTKEGINKIYEIVQLEQAQGKTISPEDDLHEKVKELLNNSGLVRKPDEMIKDGWGEVYAFEVVNNELRMISRSYEDYCEKNDIERSYPWE